MALLVLDRRAIVEQELLLWCQLREVLAWDTDLDAPRHLHRPWVLLDYLDFELLLCCSGGHEGRGHWRRRYPGAALSGSAVLRVGMVFFERTPHTKVMIPCDNSLSWSTQNT